jgi:hypothetical protein
MPSLSERLKQAALAGQSPSSSRPSSPDPARRPAAATAPEATPPPPRPEPTSAETEVAEAAPSPSDVPLPAPSEPVPAPSSPAAVKEPAPPTKSSPKPPAASGPKANGKGSAAPAAADTSRSSSQPSGSGHGHSSSFDFHLPHLSLPSFPSPFAKRAASPSAATAQGPNAGAKELATLSSSTSPTGRGRPQQSLGAFFSLGGGSSSSSSSISAPVAATARETRPEMIALPPSPRDVKLPLPEETEGELLSGEGLREESPEEKLENDEIRRLRQRVGGACSYPSRCLLRSALTCPSGLVRARDVPGELGACHP